MATTKSTRKPTRKTTKKSAKSTAKKSTRPAAKKSTRSTAKKAPTTAKRATKTARKSTAKGTRRAKSTAKKAARKTATAARKTTAAARKTTRKATRKTTGAARKATRTATRPANRGPSNRSNGRRLDAIALLKQDHREVDELFARLERSSGTRRKEQVRDAIVEALSRHAAIEETVFYPAVREDVRGADSTVLESLEEHHVVKLVLREVEDMDPSDERFMAKMTVLKENVKHHVKEEENDLFPKVRRSFDRSRLLELGDELQQAKRGAMTRPHPFAPDQPPGNALVGGAVAVVDRARTTGKKAVRKVRDELPI